MKRAKDFAVGSAVVHTTSLTKGTVVDNAVDKYGYQLVVKWAANKPSWLDLRVDAYTVVADIPLLETEYQVIADKVRHAAALLKEANDLAEKKQTSIGDQDALQVRPIMEAMNELWEQVDAAGWNSSSMTAGC
jgi:hypothetical protein